MDITFILKRLICLFSSNCCSNSSDANTKNKETQSKEEQDN